MSPAATAQIVSQNFPEFPTSGECNVKAGNAGGVGKAAGGASIDGAGEAAAPLSEKQRAAIALMLAGKSFAAVAQTLEIDRRTLFNWRRDEAFREDMDRRREELWGELIDRIRGLVLPSLDILERELADRYDRTRHRAAATLLHLSNVRKHVAPAKGK
jgi:hypothetical protein